MSIATRRTFIAELVGQVNGHPLELNGGGDIDSASGITHGTYSLKRCPSDFDPTLLSGCLITGYPNVCAAQSAVQNPFGQSNYQYTRTLKFRDGGDLFLRAECHYDDATLVSRFEVDAHIRTPSLAGVAPIIE